MDDGASLDELKRRAYSSDDADALEARERLASLEREQAAMDAAASAPRTVELVHPYAVPHWLVAVLALVSVAAVALGTVAALTPRSSLDVFSRTPTAQDLTVPTGIGALSGTERWLGSYGGYEVFAFYTHAGEICVIAAVPNEIAGTCASRVDFLQNGIDLETGRFSSTGTEYFTVQWGPYGPAHFETGNR